MKSKTAWICLISCEIALALYFAVGAAVSYGLAASLTCLESHSSPTTLPRAVPSVRPMPRTSARRNLLTNSTAKGNNMDTRKYSEVFIAAATICAEAGGEPYAGQFMVGETIANRAIQSYASVRDICLAPKQYSCWNNRGTMELRMQTMRGHPAWKDCLQIAENICQLGYTPVSPVTHFYAPKRCKPKWAKQMRLVAVVGNHRFYMERT